MIDLNRIRSLKTLEDLKQDLSEFIKFNRAELVAVYESEYGWGDEDLDADIETATDVLEKVEKRMKSLSNHLSRGVKERNEQPQSGEAESASEQPQTA